MRKFTYSFIVNSDIENVWKFYTNIDHLKIITPKNIQIKIIKTTDQILVQNSEVWFAGKIIKKSKWHSKITFLKPYEYIDEMISGPFKKWKHYHRFYKVNDKQTKILDEVELELPFGFLGRVFENYALYKLAQIFSHRKNATINALQR